KEAPLRRSSAATTAATRCRPRTGRNPDAAHDRVSNQDSNPTWPPVVADHHRPAQMPLSLPRRKPANRQAPLKRHLPRPRERHPVHGAVVGYITDLETIVCRRVNGRRAFRRNDLIDQQSRSQTAPIPAATRNVHLDNATSGATFTRTVQPSPGQDCLVQLKIARNAPRWLGFAI